MDWQQGIVLLIGIVTAGVVLRRLFCLFRGGIRGRCSSCEADCPLKELHALRPKERKDRQGR